MMLLLSLKLTARASTLVVGCGGFGFHRWQEGLLLVDWFTPKSVNKHEFWNISSMFWSRENGEKGKQCGVVGGCVCVLRKTNLHTLSSCPGNVH